MWHCCLDTREVIDSSVLIYILQDINQYQYDLERSNVTLNQQEDITHVLIQHNDEIERIIQQRRQQINELENELIKLDDLLMNSKLNDWVNFL